MAISDALCYYLNYSFEKIQRIAPIYHNPDITNVDALGIIKYLEFDRGSLELSFYKNPGISLQNKTLLDVGCGYGGRSVYYATLGARVTALDVKPVRFKLSNAFAKQYGVEDEVNFQVADARALPFSSNVFDIVMSNNAMQYILNPIQSLLEFKRVVKPDGLICINFGPPWYAPICPEAGTTFPWSHLLFSQESLKKSHSRMGRNDFFQGRTDNIYKTTNKLSIRSFKKLISSAGLDILYFKLWTRPLVAPLLHVPLLNELFCAQIISVSRKKS